jgi:hypothetical protein
MIQVLITALALFIGVPVGMLALHHHVGGKLWCRFMGWHRPIDNQLHICRDCWVNIVKDSEGCWIADKSNKSPNK